MLALKMRAMPKISWRCWSIRATPQARRSPGDRVPQASALMPAHGSLPVEIKCRQYKATGDFKSTVVFPKQSGHGVKGVSDCTSARSPRVTNTPRRNDGGRSCRTPRCIRTGSPAPRRASTRDRAHAIFDAVAVEDASDDLCGFHPWYIKCNLPIRCLNYTQW